MHVWLSCSDRACMNFTLTDSAIVAGGDKKWGGRGLVDMLLWGERVVSQARLSLGTRESGQIPIRLLYYMLSSRASDKVGVNINWDVFCKGRSSVITPRALNNMPKKATACLHSSLTQLTHQEILGVLETRWWWEFDQTLSPRESLAHETSERELTYPSPGSQAFPTSTFWSKVSECLPTNSLIPDDFLHAQPCCFHILQGTWEQKLYCCCSLLS